MIDPADLRDVFDRAASLPLEERDAFLARACRSNDTLRREVERLLAADARLGSAFDSQPASDSATDSIVAGAISLQPGIRLGPYEIETALGSGGMGEVYKARDTRLDRTVAIKVVSQDLTGDLSARQRLDREARAVAALSHPHICPLFDVGHQDGIHFLVMEYLDGETLADRLKRGRLTAHQSIEYTIQIVEALGAAHRAGIVHRDLKPANIMLSVTGVKILDFGLAKVRRSIARGEMTVASDPLTRSGTIVGTLQYMAPEQLEGKDADARTDIFASGAVFFEMLMGRRAFEGASTASTIAAILERDVPPVTTGMPPVEHSRLDAVVRTCVAKSPDDRWPSADELLLALRRIRASELVQDTSFIQRVTKGGYRLIASGRRGIVVLIALTAGAATMWRVATDRRSIPDAPLSPMTTVPLTSFPGTEGSPSFSPDGNRVTFDWRPAGAAESRIVVKAVGDDAIQELTRGAKDSHPAWSPDGRLIAFARDDDAQSGLYVVPAIGGPVRRLYAGRLYFGPGWSPDGRTLVFSATFPGPCRIISLSLETLAARPLTSTNAWDISPAVSPDGRTIVFVRDHGPYTDDLYLVPAEGGELRRLTFDQKAISGHPAWTEDGAAILFVSSRAGSPELWRVAAGGGPPERLPVAGTAVSDVALDRTGRRLAYVQGRIVDRMRIRAFDLRRPESPPVDIIDSSRSDHSPAFSRDGKRIAFSSDRGGEARNIWIADADGSDPVRLTNFAQGGSGSPQWSADGEWVAFDREGDIFVVRVAGGTPRRLTTDPAEDFAPSWSNDGRWIYFGSDRGGKDQVWKMPIAGGEPVQLTKHGGGCALESADGKWLYYTKSNGQDGIWRMPSDGGLEEPVLNDLPSGWYNRYWALVENGIYYLNTRNNNRQSVEFLLFSTRRVKRVFDLPEPAGPDWSSSFAVSPDERKLFTVFIVQAATDIMLVENFQSAAAERR